MCRNLEKKKNTTAKNGKKLQKDRKKNKQTNKVKKKINLHFFLDVLFEIYNSFLTFSSRKTW